MLRLQKTMMLVCITSMSSDVAYVVAVLNMNVGSGVIEDSCSSSRSDVVYVIAVLYKGCTLC